MSATPFFSIVIPCYNAAAVLPNALESILTQSFSDVEILVVDAVSKDSTVAIAKQRADDRIRILSEKDNGTYDAMNKGIDIANGRWLYFMGSDDTLMDDSVLQDVHDFIIRNNSKVVYGDVLIKGDTLWAKDGDVYAGKFNARKLYKKNICHQSIFYNRDFLMQYQIKYNIQFPVNADWEFNFQCWAKANFGYMQRIIAQFSAGGLSTRKNVEPAFAKIRSAYMPLSQKLINRWEKFKRKFNKQSSDLRLQEGS